MLAVSTSCAHIFITPATNQGGASGSPLPRSALFPIRRRAASFAEGGQEFLSNCYWPRFGGAFSLLE